MELDSGLVLQLIAGLVAGVLGIWKIFDLVKLSKASGKIANVLEKGADGLDGLAVIAKSAGMDKVAYVLQEVSDPIDKAGDLFQAISDSTVDGEFTKDEMLNVLNEGKEVFVEGKDFYLKVIKKPE